MKNKLKTLHCTHCDRNCPLSKPKCSHGKKQAKQIKKQYKADQN